MFVSMYSHKHMLPFIHIWVASENVIDTNSRTSYQNLQRIGYSHKVGNRSINFSQNEIDTNSIEGIFGCFKKISNNFQFRYCEDEQLNNILTKFSFRFTYEYWSRK